MVDTQAAFIPDADSMLAGESIPSLSFSDVPVGTSYTGTIVELGTSQVTDFVTKQPKFWDDGKPQVQVIVTLQTDERDPERHDDTGLRKAYLFGGKLSAARTAMREAGIKKLETGFKFTIAYVGTEPAKTKGFNPVKLYKVTIDPTKSNKTVDDILADAGATPIKAAASGKLSAEQEAKVRALHASNFNVQEIADAIKVQDLPAIQAVIDSELL